tara:strand:- start:337 stop:504 length:168 start_codon:yes stop_codon:yes gene_type:complete
MKGKHKCSLCEAEMELDYVPMEEWKIDGFLCSKCYSQKLAEFYPGEHVRVEPSEE